MDNNTQRVNNMNSTAGLDSNLTQSQSLKTNNKPTGLIVSMVVCIILAVAGITFGVYTFMDSNQKTQRISELETKVNNKDIEIAELESKISVTDSETLEIATDMESTDQVTTPTQEMSSETAKIALGDIIDEDETRTVFNIGSCTSDGPSTKCHVEVDGKEALISHVDTDNILRLTIPKE